MVWGLRRRFNTIDELTEWIMKFEICLLLKERRIFPEEYIDSRLDEYFITGTFALCCLGECWNLTAPSGILLAVSKDELKEAEEVAGVISENTDYTVSIIVKEDLRKCDYFLDEEVGVMFASRLQAYLDSFTNRSTWGVDFFESLISFAGYELARWTSDPRLALRYLELTKAQYPKDLQEALEPPYILLLLLYSFLNVDEALWLAKMMMPPRNIKPDRIYYEALRSTLLGNTVSARLGLEPLVTRGGVVWA